MNLPLVKDAIAPGDINLGSEEWFRWLGRVKSFRYCPNSDGYYYLRADITVRNRTRNYWYAYRKVNGTQRTFYLGKTSELDYERLQLAVDELSLSSMDYYKLISDRKSGVQEKKENKKYNSPQAGEEFSPSPDRSSPLGCTKEELYTLTQVNEQLRVELERSQSRVVELEEIEELAKEVVASMVQGRNNMTSGPSLANLRDKLKD